MKYGIKMNTCGVYMIRNKITNDSYIGSSVNIAGRISQHLSLKRDLCNDKLHNDVIKYGVDNFEWEVLCECSKERLLEMEQYFYDTMKPTYNYVRPSECHVTEPIIKEKAMKICRTEEFKNQKHDQYSKPEYRKLFHDIQKKRMKPVMLIGDKMNIGFESLSSAAKWIEYHYGDKFKGKNKVSKIKSVCDGERQSAYGFKWQYVKCNDYPGRE